MWYKGKRSSTQSPLKRYLLTRGKTDVVHPDRYMLLQGGTMIHFGKVEVSSCDAQYDGDDFIGMLLCTI